MDKSAIRNFAIEARNILMKSAVSEAGLYGISKNGCSNPVQKGEDFEIYETIAGTQNRIFGADIKRRANLVQAIEQQGFDQVIEETAYTWFNRIIAIRFMEVNNYLPSRVRVLSSETGSSTPDIVAQSDTIDLNMTEEELQKVREAKNNNKYDEAFRLLFVKQCNELNAILPGLFEKTNDYMELLLKLSYTGDGVVRMLIDTIPEDNFNVETEGQVEIIGWMYQYYNTDNFNLVYDGNMSRKKVDKNHLPAATQLFTPDWVVNQMNENTIVTLLYQKEEYENFKYVVDDSCEIDDSKVHVSEIKVLDPSMGSGHFLVNAFDIILKKYIEEGFNERDATVLTLENNIYGMDIDKRAYQLSYFSLMMKAREHNRLIFRHNLNLNICHFVSLTKDFVHSVEHSKILDDDQKQVLLKLYEHYKDIDEIGTIIKASNIRMEQIEQIESTIEKIDVENLLDYSDKETILSGLRVIKKQHELLGTKYDAVVTNPPYLGSARMSPVLLKYVTENYSDAKADLSMVFYDKVYRDLLKDHGNVAFVTTTSWMYLSTYEQFRKNMISEMSFLLLVEYGTELFEGKIGHLPIVSWVCTKDHQDRPMNAIRLVDFCYKNRDQKIIEYFNENNRYRIQQNKFMKLPSYPIAYWLAEDFYDLMDNRDCYVKDISVKKAGLVTGNDEYFIRLWYEVDRGEIDFNSDSFAIDQDMKYNVIAKGGSSRQYYGNFEYVIKLRDLWDPEKTNVSVRRGDIDYYLKKAIGWSQIGNTQKTFRVIRNAVCGTATPTIYVKDERYYLYLLGYLNSKIARQLLDVFNPTLNLMSTDIGNLPVIINENYLDEINELVEQLIKEYEIEWNKSECSWNFETHPFIRHRDIKRISDIVKLVNEESKRVVEHVNTIQGRLDEIFSKICSVNVSHIGEKELNFRSGDDKSMVTDFMSFFVGCLFGRYSIDEDGLCYASKGDHLPQSEFVDHDGIIPITDDTYFQDDIVRLFEEFIGTIFGTEYVQENIDYIAKTISTQKVDSNEAIRQYFIKNFMKDHIQKYQKKPIYWMFDTGKENGFKCLVYIHRYNKDTVGLIRTDYLIKAQSAMENAQKNAEYVIQTSASAVDRAQATKQRDKYIKQLAELRTYYQALSHVAQQRIELDLDDGVKANYAKFQGIEVSIEGEKKQTIDLLAKI